MEKPSSTNHSCLFPRSSWLYVCPQVSLSSTLNPKLLIVCDFLFTLDRGPYQITLNVNKCKCNCKKEKCFHSVHSFSVCNNYHSLFKIYSEFIASICILSISNVPQYFWFYPYPYFGLHVILLNVYNGL